MERLSDGKMESLMAANSARQNLPAIFGRISGELCATKFTGNFCENQWRRTLREKIYGEGKFMGYAKKIPAFGV